MSAIGINGAKKQKILVIEGSVSFGRRIVEELNSNGFEATLVTNGIEAIKLIYNILPRLIILNTASPYFDSYNLLKQKDSEPLLKKIPVFLVSTQGLPINMNKIPQNSVTQIIMLFREDPADLVVRVKKYLDELSGGNSSNGKNGDRKINVLWLENDKLVSNIYGKKMIYSGFNLKLVDNGDEAFKILTSDKSVFIPDIFILDPYLTGMNGIEILQKLDKTPDIKKIPIMILTNVDRESDREKTRLLGAQVYIIKSHSSPDQIIQEIQNLL